MLEAYVKIPLKVEQKKLDWWYLKSRVVPKVQLDHPFTHQQACSSLHIIHFDIISPITTMPCTQHSLNTYAHAHGQWATQCVVLCCLLRQRVSRSRGQIRNYSSRQYS
jgi:hypothetical protein